MEPKENSNYLELNKKSWNQRTTIHFDSEFYDNNSFIAGRSSLNEIELSLLGDIKGKRILHLQCHFGQDSISLARMGAQVTGVDLSDQAIEKGRELAKSCHVDCQFICCDVYSLKQYLHETFDIVYTSYGTIAWLPDLDQWAAIVSHFLRPGGRFVFAEFHPAVWMYDDDFTSVQYSYFNDAPIAETESGTYADQNADNEFEYVCWNHGLAEVYNALKNNAILIDTFEEYNYSPYPCFKNTEEFEPGKFRIKNFGNKMPLVYGLTGIKS